MSRIALPALVACVVSAWSADAFAQTTTTPGAITLPYPTTQAISIEWAITGDSNNNGVVGVRYRPTGTTTWTTGMPLIRVPAGSNSTGSFGSGGGNWANRHSGSLFDIAAGTTYEIELTLTDPDGGAATQMVTATTRPIPQAAANATMKAVTPSNLTSMLSGAMPGDVLLLGAGNYPAFTVSRNGSAGMPIVIRGASTTGVIIGGRVTMEDRQHVYLENVTVMGEVRMSGASNSVVRGCRIQTATSGITFQIGDAVPRNNFIVDNDVIGAAMWIDSQLSSDGFNGGEGIQFTGSGHVICFNHIKGFRDNISLMEYDEGHEQTSIDICNNDIEEATDDGIEADTAMGNVRVLRNRIRNCFDGISAQPNLGGPTYYIRNAMYNVLYTPFKFHNATVGDIGYHNTVVKCGDAFGIYAGATWRRALFRNNLFIGGMGGGTYGGVSNGSGRIMSLDDADASCSFDYDGFGSVGVTSFNGSVGSARFTSLATLKSATTEAHAVQVDMSVFATAVPFPSSPFPPKAPADMRLASGSAAVDKGIAIPGLEAEVSGAAPDLGAYELGAPMPTYGPRSGSTGAAGTTGTTGAAGTTGPSTGVAGRGGTSGAAGRGGTSGSAGVTGAAGTIPITGAAGTTGAGDSGGGNATGAAGDGSPTGAAGDSGGPGGTGSPGIAAGEVVGSCACSSGGAPGAGGLALFGLAAALAGRRRRRR